jgi:hypothetical protein
VSPVSPAATSALSSDLLGPSPSGGRASLVSGFRIPKGSKEDKDEAKAKKKKNLGHSIHSQFMFISDLMMYFVPVGVSWMPQYVGIC